MKKKKIMLSLAWTELQTLFYSPVAWLILVIFTVQAAIALTNNMEIYTRSASLGYAVRNLTLSYVTGQRGLFTIMQQYLYMYIPLLTMGLMSRELGSGSIKLLYSSPITNRQIIGGKFLAMMAYGGVLIGILFAFVLYAALTIKMPDFPTIFTGLLGLYLLICAYAAIGLFMSSLTSYQVVAAIGTFTLLWFLSFVGDLWQEIPFVREITWWLSINGRAGEFIRGMICSEDLLYFLIVIALFLSLTVLRLQAIRQKIPGVRSWGKYIAVFVMAMFLGYLSSRPKLMNFYDATRTKVLTLTPHSQEIIKQVKGGLTMTSFVNILDDDYTFGIPRNVKRDIAHYKQYWRFKPEIKMKYVYYYDRSSGTDLDKAYPTLTDRERMIKRTTSYRLDSNLFIAPEQVRKMADLPSEGNRYVIQLKRENGEETFLRLFDDIAKRPNESETTAALKRLVMQLPIVGFIQGHGARDCRREADRSYKRFTRDKPYRYSLINQGFDFEEISLEEPVPAYISIVVLADLRTTFSETEQKHFQEYIDRGGNLLIAGEPGKQEVMNKLTEPLGVRFMPGTLVRPTEDFQSDFLLSYPTREAIALSHHFETMKRWHGVVTMPGCTALEYSSDRGFSVTPLFVSDSTGVWLETETEDFINDTVRLNPAAGEVEKSYVTTLALSREINGKEQKIIIAGDADCFSNGELRIQRNQVRAYNYMLINGAFFWFSDGEVPIDTRRPEPPDNQIYIGMKGMTIAKILMLGVVPALLFLAAMLLWIRRRGR